MDYDVPDTEFTRMMERYSVAGQIVDALVKLKEYVKPNEWPFNHVFDHHRSLMVVVGDDGSDFLFLSYTDNHVQIVNEVGDGYCDVKALGKTIDRTNGNAVVNYMILDDNGAALFPPGLLLEMGKTEDNQLILCEDPERLVILVGDRAHAIPKTDLLTTTHPIFSYPSVQVLFNDLLLEGIFTE